MTGAYEPEPKPVGDPNPGSGPEPEPAPDAPDAPKGGAESVPAFASESAVGTELRRLHPLTPALKGWKYFLVVAVLIGQRSMQNWDLRLFGLQLLGALILGAILGLFSWWFTKYRIVDDELWVDSGFLFRRSRRIRLDRLQAVDVVRPVLARLAGLAELRLEVAGGGKTEAPLEYLSESDAARLRAELLARAAGLDADTPEAPERPLVAVPPGALFASALLSAPFLVALVGFIGVTITTIVSQQPVGLAFIVPWALGGIGVLYRGFVSEFGFAVSESPDGLRIRKGLLDTWAQTVPPGRVQGVAIEQQCLWRPKDWVKLSVDVAGYGLASSEGPTNSTLLPVAPWPVARALLERVLPGVDVDSIPRNRAPRRARWLRPIGWRFLAYGWNSDVFITVQGWVTRRTSLVLHGKMQSVRGVQGPVQRRLRLATVHVDTPIGPVHATALHRDVDEARTLIQDQSERSGAARRSARPERWML